MAITNFVWVELDRAIHKELNNAKFYIIWSIIVVSANFENVKWLKMYGIALEKMKWCSTQSEESEFSQSVSWSKDRKQLENNGNVQM